ncbi:MAG: hypothetical protein H8E73_06180 [Planctomycetes bacterium]|nr:hypothetical protein [Planctomycetota bacterium]
MRKTAGILAGCAILVLGFLLFFKDSTGEDSPIPEPASSPVEVVQETDDDELVKSAMSGDSSVTLDEFNQLSEARQDEMLEEFVLDFWERELRLSDETKPDERSLSLEIFNRPYMQTLTERELFRLSPEDRERAIAEVMENCQEVRNHVNGIVAEAESLMADKDYLNAEAYFIYTLEMGRELSVNKEGLIITRLAGIATEKVALNGLVKLYTQTRDDSKVQIARDQLSQIETEVQEIKRTAKEAEAKR